MVASLPPANHKRSPDERTAAARQALLDLEGDSDGVSALETICSEVWAVLALAPQDEYARVRLFLHLFWGAVPPNSGEPTHSNVVYTRVLDYVEATPKRLKWFHTLPSPLGLKDAFHALAYGSDGRGIAEFNKNLERLLVAQGRADRGAGAIGGLSRPTYLSMAIVGFEPTMGYVEGLDDYDYKPLAENNPAFWAAFAKFGVERGVTPDEALCGRARLECYDHVGPELTFVQAVERQVGEECAQVFLALYREHTMQRTIVAAPEPESTSTSTKPRARRPSV